MLKQQHLKKLSDKANTIQDIVQVNHRLLENRLWSTVRDLKLINQIISGQSGKNQGNNISQLQLINAVDAIKKESELIEGTFLKK